MRRPGFLVFVLAISSLQAGQGEDRPAYLLEVPDTVDTVLIAETDTSTLHVFHKVAGRLQPGSQSYMSIGQNGAGKQRAWDRRTPLGVYFINDRLDTGGMHEKYGPVAFPLDYPNTWDRINHRDGDGIWIHGVTPQGGRRPRLDTDGCIALPNENLLALEPELAALDTPVVITRRIDWSSSQDLSRERGELLAALDDWARSFGSGDLYRNLSLYAEDFSYRGLSRDEWGLFRTRSFEQAPPQNVAIDDVLLIADPEEHGLYLSRFRHTIDYGDRQVTTTKRLYWRRFGNDELRIVAEDNG